MKKYDSDPFFSPNGDPLVRFNHKTQEFTLQERVTYTRNGQKFYLPTGFRFDGASVPRILWALFPPHGRYVRAAMVHDYLYRTGIGTRKEADVEFRKIMEYDGLSWPVRWIMYIGVRLGGWIAWKGF